MALERSIDVQVTRLRRKIEDDPKLPLYLQTVRGVGYVLGAGSRLSDDGRARFIKRFLPRGLFGRSLIIIVAPMVLLQGVVTYVFFERDLDTTTRRLARDVAADVALLATLEDSTPTLERDARARAVGAAIALSPHLP